MSRDDQNRWEARYAGDAAALSLQPPSPFLRAHAPLLHGRILDIAAGAGRNALFLADRGNVVHAIDVACGGLAALQVAARRAERAVHCLQADLETYPLRPAYYDAIIDIRYLQRSLFASMRRALRPGGVVLVETFLREQAQSGHPRNPAFLLERGELLAAFAGFEILVHSEGRVDDGGEPAHLGRIIARRPESTPV